MPTMAKFALCVLESDMVMAVTCGNPMGMAKNLEKLAKTAQ